MYPYLFSRHGNFGVCRVDGQIFLYHGTSISALKARGGGIGRENLFAIWAGEKMAPSN